MLSSQTWQVYFTKPLHLLSSTSCILFNREHFLPPHLSFSCSLFSDIILVSRVNQFRAESFFYSLYFCLHLNSQWILKEGISLRLCDKPFARQNRRTRSHKRRIDKYKYFCLNTPIRSFKE